MRRTNTPIQPRGRQSGQTLIILFFGFLFAGGGAGGSLLLLNDMAEQFGWREPDRAKRQRVENVLALISQETGRLDSERTRLENQAFRAFERHDTTPEEFRALTARADVVKAEWSKTLIDLRFMLRRQISSDSQWAGIFFVR